MKNELKVFENSNIRSIYDEEREKWYFSVIDIISILTESKNPRRYWSDLKIKLNEDEGFAQLYEKIVQLKLQATDGKKYNTDCADVETLLRIIQSIPSKKAEPVKQWLAKVGYERMQEMSDPSTAIDRARETYKQLKIFYSTDKDELKVQICFTLLKYQYPQRKAIDINTEDTKLPTININGFKI